MIAKAATEVPSDHRPALGGVAALVAAVAAVTVATMAQVEALDSGLSPGVVLGAQFAVAGAVALLFAPVLLPSARDWNPSPILALAGIVLACLVFTALAGLERLPAGILILLSFAAPLWVAVFETVVRRHALRMELVGVLAIVFAGLAVMVNPFSFSLDLAGIAFGLLTSLGFAAFILLVGNERSGAAAPTAGTVLVFCALASIVIALASGGDDLLAALSRPEILIAGLALWLWIVFFAAGLGLISPLTASLISAAEPATVAAGAYFWFGESLTAWELLGGLILIVGVSGAAFLEQGTARPALAGNPPSEGGG